MGINITAIFPISQFGKRFDKIIDKIENQEYPSIQAYYQTTLEEGFPDLGNHKPQWYLNDEKVTQRPQLPNLHAELSLPEGLVIRFRDNGFEIWSVIRAFIAIKHHPKVAQKLVAIYKEIGRDVQINECLVMGDWNPIYLSFRKGNPYKLIALKDPRKNSLEDIYIEDTDSYDIIGHYLVKISEI
ncbi:hypothetical protein [uncultured Dokdonia sp.]|uniref:hypothetical protein n=1 Tax=uncultured Dokdonia sp. TaxID=575653 RepID=UPI00262C4848|nr:hypothetical protein [uncultured Dokdonia sp.]